MRESRYHKGMLDTQPLTSPTARIARCCDSHADWPTLARHLCADFPLVNPADVLREVAVARSAVTGLMHDRSQMMLIGELISRNQLLLLSGERRETAHLDPQTHTGRGATY